MIDSWVLLVIRQVGVWVGTQYHDFAIVQNLAPNDIISSR